MPKYKLKTHKGTAKRFRTTGTGKVMRRKARVSHNRGKNSANQSVRSKRRRDFEVAENPRVAELIPYK